MRAVCEDMRFWFPTVWVVFYGILIQLSVSQEKVQQRPFEEILQKQGHVCFDNTVGHHKSASAAMCGALLLTEQESVIFTFDKMEHICRTYREIDFIGCLFQACTSCRSYKLGEYEKNETVTSGTGFCSTAPNGLHPHPSDCSMYYNCWDGVGDPIKCPDGQLYTTLYNGCDYADRVECNTADTSTALATSGTGFCSTAPNGLYPHPSDCSMYYNCWDGVGDPIKCPDGQLYTTLYNGCDYEYRVECNTAGTTTPGTGFCSTAPNGLHPHPSDCSQYYNCWDGVGDAIKCPDGQLYSTVYNGCDYAERVQC